MRAAGATESGARTLKALCQGVQPATHALGMTWARLFCSVRTSVAVWATATRLAARPRTAARVQVPGEENAKERRIFLRCAVCVWRARRAVRRKASGGARQRQRGEKRFARRRTRTARGLQGLPIGVSLSVCEALAGSVRRCAWCRASWLVFDESARSPRHIRTQTTRGRGRASRRDRRDRLTFSRALRVSLGKHTVQKQRRASVLGRTA